MGFYLLDNRNPNGDHFYRSRNKDLLHIVLHITAGLENFSGGADSSAERTARYAATTSTKVSWHAGADSDSFLYLLPASFTAFHCQGFNASGYGLEISKRNTDWSTAPAAWVEATLRNAARAIAPIVKDHGIPLVRLTRAQAANGQKGFLYHSDADPSRRSDPGRNFPLERLFALIREILNPTTAQKEDDEMVLSKGSKGPAVRLFQNCLINEAARARARGHARTGLPRFGADGDYGDETVVAVREYQTAAQVGVTGNIDGLTSALLLRYEEA